MRYSQMLYLGTLIPVCVFGQNICPNPSFETGTIMPASWALSSGIGQLQPFGRTGSNCVNITSAGSGLTRWSTFNPPVTNGQVYAVHFWACTSNAISGSSFGGFNTVYSDFALPGNAWTHYSMVAWLPNDPDAYLNIGQVSLNGSLYFDDVELYRVTPVHKLAGGISLGTGEKVLSGKYTYQSGYNANGGSYSRCLQEANTRFAGFRWYFNPGSTLVYRHNLGGLPMTNVTVKGGIWNYNSITNTSLEVEASTNGVDWLPSGAMTGGATSLTADVPASLLPAPEVFIRLKSTNAAQFSLTNYVFSADVTTTQDVEGVTYFAEQYQASSVVTPLNVSDSPTGQVLTVTVANPGAAQVYAFYGSASQPGGTTNSWSLSTNVPAASTNSFEILLPQVGVGDNFMAVTVTNGSGTVVFNIGFIAKVTVTESGGEFGNLAPNPSFEIGGVAPDSWFGYSHWRNFGRTGSRCTSITATGTDVLKVTTLGCPTTAGTTYAVHYWTMGSNAISGSCLGGFTSVYRDFNRPSDTWRRNTVVAYMPTNVVANLNIGVVTLNGTVFFDDVEVYRTVPVHLTVGAHKLAAGETLSPGSYGYHTPSSSPQLSDYVGNYARSLQSANTGFAGHRWYLNQGSQVIHRHELSGVLMTSAVISGEIWNYYAITGVSLEVEVSTNGADWQMAGQMSNAPSLHPKFSFDAPANLFPTPEVYVRFKSSNALQFSLTDYSFTAGMPDNRTIAKGDTYFFEQRAAHPGFRPVELVDRPTGRVATVALPNATPDAQTFSIQSQAEFNGHLRTWTFSTNIPALQTNTVDVVIPTSGYGENAVCIVVTNGVGEKVFENSLTFWVTMLEDDSYGERLPSPASTPVWWCDGTYKVGRTRAGPLATNDAVQISAARNEYEPFQLALRPNTPMTNVSVTLTDFALTGGGATISSTNVTLAMVEYVPVTELHYAHENTVGDTADPLVPVTGPFNAPAFTNTTVWFTVKVPKDVPAGIYLATVNISHDDGAFTVPVRLRVRGFSLSDATHTANVMTVIVPTPWHLPANDDDRRAIWNLYIENMARHRVTPYLPQEYDQVEFSLDYGTGQVTADFTAFDAAMSHYLDDLNFTSFQWMDERREDFGLGGTLRFAYDGSSNKIINPAFKPLYPKLAQPVAQHLREKGWFDKAYSYWIDEPALDTSAAVLSLAKEGFQMIGEAAPGLKRMLPANTYDFPKPDLYGDVEIWVPAFDPWSFKHERNVERQAQGELVWPYVFIRPFSPWPNNFIDQTASSPRIRFWIGEKLNWDGDLYWGINYYFDVPGVGARNPWITPFVRDGEAPFGNGDGSLVYPPAKEYPTNTLIAGPMDSIRWEIIREGAEDREYFWLLKQLIARAEIRLGTSHPSVLAARAAQNAALEFVPYPPVHPYEPEDMYASRGIVAQAIEALDDGAPIIANQPTSKAGWTGTSEYLKMEALGWPLPAIQWQHEGTNVPGGDGARLMLTNINLDMAGSYRAIAVNSAGSVTSSVVTFTVIDPSLPPQILQQPASLSRSIGGRAVFGVMASSATPLTYQWLFNDAPISGATNLTLLLTNLTYPQSGNYSVVVSNTVGAVSSSQAVLILPPPPLPSPPVLQMQMTAGGLQIGIDQLYAPAEIQFSTNLVDWQVLTNLPASAGNVNAYDPVTNAPCRFYRVVMQ